MTLEYHNTTEKEKYEICKWKYENEYKIYNNISYEEQIEKNCGFANQKNNFYSFCDHDNIIGYVNLVEEETKVFFGIGVNPLFCNQGYGQKITKIACNISRQLYPEKPIYLEVRVWNIRAIKCYEKSGFHIIGEPISKKTFIGEGRFYYMLLS